MMEIIDHLGLGFSVALTLKNIGLCFVGCLVGTLVGVLPGVGPVATISILLPVTLALALYVSRKKAQGGGSGYRLRAIFPWFVLGFLAASVVRTFLPVPVALGQALVQVGKFLIVMAMAAIGLNTNLVKLIKNGWRPILMGFGCWAALSVTSLIVQYGILR